VSSPRYSRLFHTGRGIISLSLGIFLSGIMAFAGTSAAHAESYDPITGTGSTWSQNALDQWRKNVASNYGMTVNYSGTGSSAGRRDYIGGTVDYAVSEIPFQVKPEDGSPPEVPPRGFAYMPIVAGGTALMYNLKIGGQQVSNLRLSGDTITKIFKGTISNWNDAAIAADNPGLAMPDKGITPVVRSDGSGSTAQFTLWMSKQYPSLWTTGMTSQFPTLPNFKYQSGSSGVAGYVSQNYGDGAITYVEYSYALEAGFPVAKVLNAAGYYVEPTANSVAVALLKAQIAPDLTQILDGVYNNADPRTYAMSSYSYMIVPTEVGGVFTAGKGKTLSTFAKYMLCEGQQQAADLGYSPLPMNLVTAGFAQVARIPGTAVAAFDPTSCNNPTFKPGDSPDTNQLALTASQPAECDKKGPNQCTTGTGGAAGVETAVSGTGNGGSASGATGASGAGSTGSTSVAGTAVDEYGNPVAGGTGVAGAVSASPFSLEQDTWGAPQNMMLGAGLFLVFAAVIPPFVAPQMQHLLGKKKKLKP
jgi:phosphate transport system substrate-binding protein